MIKLANLNAQHSQLFTQIQDAIYTVIDNSRFVGGDPVVDFERNFAKYCQTEYCLGVGNGTDALEIAIASLDLPLGSEIIVPANSFVASAEAIVNTGHIPVFIDCDINSHGLCIEQLESVINTNTRAIIVVHLFGNPVDMCRVMTLAKKFGLKVIEDAAQAHGARWKKQSVGSIGDISTFSFFPGKNLGAMGDGGAICTNNEKLFERSKMIANHGRDSKFDHKMLGRNSRLDTLQAAILNVKLPHLESWNQTRQANADFYFEALSGLDGIEVLTLSPDATGVFHQFVVRLSQRQKCQQFMAQHGIETGVHYPRIITQYPPFAHFESSTPNSKLFADTMLSIPVHQYLSKSDKQHVVDTIKRFVESNLKLKFSEYEKVDVRHNA